VISSSSQARYCCRDQIGFQNRICWEREILGPKENCEEEFRLMQFELKTEEIRIKPSFGIFSNLTF
jgi:hypothetical protein